MKVVIWRGLAAGAIAGAIAALFLAFVTEVQIDQALKFEEAAGIGLPPDDAAMFSRGTQVWGGMAATMLYGMFLGVILAVVFASLHDRVRSRDEFGRVLKVSIGIFVATGLLPWIKYPPNPPAVGDPDTVNVRTVAYFGFLLASILIVFAIWRTWNWLTNRGNTGGRRFLGTAFVGLVLISLALIFFPAPADRIEPPLNESVPGLEVSGLAETAVLDAMLETARETDDSSFREPGNSSERLDLRDPASGTEIIGIPVATSTQRLVPHVFTTVVWSFRLKSLAGLALMWIVMAGALGAMLDRYLQPYEELLE